MMLNIENLQAAYGASRVLFDVNLAAGEGECVTLLGRNGMGKTTTIRCIMGLLKPAAGAITFRGEAVTGLAPEMVARRGVGLVPEGRQVFPTLTVRENLVATAANRLGRADPWTMERVCELFPRLGERASQWANTLSGGEQQMLAIGRALMASPTLLLLDEPSVGLAPNLVREIMGLLQRLRDEGLTILLVEQDAHAALRIADRGYVMETGRIVAEGASRELLNSARLRRAYLGMA